eukprot:TRINITY_DN212_c0_g1_i4.p1 TRINITY_DN212_c0_g1~~TRINITY_DN212_c0_g1_i4.p1  ORF type:complete len:247 (+),score=51.63 TRINITY_DN212_c0_g1_i4:202-942(+)
MEVEQKNLPENLKKKITRNDKIKKAVEEKKKALREVHKKLKAQIIAKAQQYQKEYLESQKQLVDAKRKAKKNGEFYVQDEPKVGLIIRIRGTQKVHPDVQKILRLFRLRQIHNASFFKINKATVNMIKKVLPFVTLGYPTRSTIEKLIYKRGYAKINKQRIPITSNLLIQQHLGRYGINSMEDLIHEIATCGPHFKEANSFLWCFKLDTPKGGYRSKRHPFHTDGDWGNREQFINDFAQSLSLIHI